MDVFYTQTIKLSREGLSIFVLTQLVTCTNSTGMFQNNFSITGKSIIFFAAWMRIQRQTNGDVITIGG